LSCRHLFLIYKALNMLTKTTKETQTYLLIWCRVLCISALVVACGGGGGGDGQPTSIQPTPADTTVVTTPVYPPTSPTNPASGPSGAHPRLWLSDSATMNRLMAAAKANSPEWQKVKNICDNKTEPDYDYQGSQPFRYIAAFALCYRVVKANSGDAAAEPYAQKAINLLQSNAKYPVLGFTAYQTDSGYGIRNYAPAMAVAYDWLYDYPGMTPSLKAQVATRLKAWLSWYEANGYGNADHYISNYNGGFMSARVLTSIALFNEDPQSAELWTKALGHYNGARQVFDKAMPGGHWPEGWNYGAGVYQEYAWSASALKIATGDAGFLNFNWLSNNVLLKLHTLLPEGKFFYADGAWTGNGYGSPSLNDIMIAGHAFGWASGKGQLARSYIDRAVAGGAKLVEDEWKGFLFYDNASKPADIMSASKSFHALGTGLVTMRSDWASSDATWASVMAGPYLSYQGSQDKDQGHMEVYKSAPLLIDVSHDYYEPGYTKNTVFQNTYTLEKRGDDTRNPANPYAGQDSYTDLCPNPTDNNPIGINGYADGGAYVFSSGEFSAAYQYPPTDSSVSNCGPNAVTWLNRSTLYLRPGLMVVYDQIQKTAAQSGVVPTMHMHFPTAPTVQAGNRQLTIDNGTGRLQAVTVLPTASNSTLVKENATSAFPGPNVTNWHLSVAYADPSPLYQKFLTVMRAGQSTAAYVFPAVTAISGTNASGSLIGGLLPAESATPIAVVFAEGGAPRVIPVIVQYQYTASSATQNYVAKLKPNTFYSITSSSTSGVVSVTVTESVSGTKSDAAGVLIFSQ
jgi:hypothetical protein